MSLNRTRPNETRTPEFKELPDGRKRLTRYFALPNGTGLTDNLVEAYGTADVGPATGTTAGFASLRLVDQYLERDEPSRDPNASHYVKVYEELPATAEQQVGSNSSIKLEDGRTGLEANFLQLVAGTYTPGTVGSSTATGDASAFLQREEMTNDGTVRRIKRIYVYAGTLSQSDETKNNGALLLRTLVAVKTEPSTPIGYTVISQDKKSVNGLIVYTYTFAKGDGEISREVTASQAGQYSSTEAVTSVGINLWTIRHLTALSVTVNPTSAPAVGAICVSLDKNFQDGYILWTARWALGTGTIVVTDVQTKEGGKLIIYHRVAVTPNSSYTFSAPSATISGTVTLIDAKFRYADGYNIYDYTWAEGLGEISRSIDYSQSSDAGTTGATKTTIRYLVAPAGTVLPTSLAGSVELGRDYTDQDGSRIWTTVWGKGTGIVITTDELHNNGKLVLYRRVALGSAPSAPAATITGTVVSTGTGYREAEGFKVYDYTWAEGYGVIRKSYQQRPGGLRLESWVSLGTAYDSDFMLPTGVLMAKDYEEANGYQIWTVTCMQLSASGADPTSGTALTNTTLHPFTYPGRAKTITTTFTLLGANFSIFDVYRSPPVTLPLTSTVKITYQTSTSLGSLDYTLWAPDTWATIYAYFLAWNTYPKAIIEPLPGYRSISETATTFNGGSGYGGGYLQTCLGERVYQIGAGSPYSLATKGGPVAPDTNTYVLSAELEAEPAFVAYDGTKYYRKTQIYATIPTQTALPV